MSVPFPLVATIETTAAYKNGCGLTRPTLHMRSIRYYLLPVPPYIMVKKTFKNVKMIKDCPKMYGNMKISAMSRMNVAKSYGDLFYIPKSLPGCFCSVILLRAKKKDVF